MRDAKYSTEMRIGSQSDAQEPIMLAGWNHWMEKIFNILGALTMNNRQKISRRQTQTAEKIRMKSVFARCKKREKNHRDPSASTRIYTEIKAGAGENIFC